MYYDYFLMHRAFQVQRLRAAQAGNSLELPTRLARAGATKAVGQLCRIIDTICGWDLGDKPKRERGGWWKVRSRWWWPWATAAENQEEDAGDAAVRPMLTAEQRAAVNELETSLVQARLGDDAAASQLAAEIMDALWRDAEFFNGLKPLALHTENFPYEFLYPTWFNLYTALHTTGQAEPPFSAAQVKTLFQFLDSHEQGGASRDPELVGLLTFLARRYPPAEARDLTQRLIDLCGCPESALAVAAAAVVRPLREMTQTLAEFRQLVRHYLIVETCSHQDAIRTRWRISPRAAPDHPLPSAVRTRLRELEYDIGRDTPYTQLLHGVGRIVTEAGGFAGEFEKLLNRQAAAVLELVALVAPREETVAPLCLRGQRLVTRLLVREQQRTGDLEVARVRPFVRVLAPRLDPLDEGLEHVLVAQWVDDEANRQVLLDSAADPARRVPLAASLLGAAKKTDDRARFFQLVELAAVLDPARPVEALRKIRQSAQVVRLAVQNGTIITTQLADLVHDLQRHLPASLAYLEAPAEAAAGKSERLQRLYLTLAHERGVYARTGSIGNFSATLAAQPRTKSAGDEAAPPA